jgi:hypothetical protein
MKLVISAAPLKDYYGFPMVRGRPFFKSEGKNEIVVKTSRADVKCWFYGQADGLGTINLLGESNAYNADNMYIESPY